MARYPFVYTSAQTDTVLVSVPSGQGFRVTGYEFWVDRSVTAQLVECRFEFDDTTDVWFGGHPGLAPGSGVSRANAYGDESLADGADGQDVLITCDAPTGGEVRGAVNGYFLYF